MTTILAFRCHSSDVSIRTAVGKTTDNIMALLDKFPALEISFTWMLGELHPSDFNSKVNLDPVAKSNSNLLRKGPTMYLVLQSLKEVSCGHISEDYYQFTPHDKLTDIEGEVGFMTMYTCLREMLMTDTERVLQAAFRNQSHDRSETTTNTISLNFSCPQ